MEHSCNAEKKTERDYVYNCNNIGDVTTQKTQNDPNYSGADPIADLRADKRPTQDSLSSVAAATNCSCPVFFHRIQ